MSKINRITKTSMKYDIEKIKEEIKFLEDKQEYKLGDERTDVGMILMNEDVDDTWEMSKIKKDFNLDMAGIARMNPKTCYAFHYDYSPRVHVAIDTSEDNFFLFSDTKQYHIPMNGHAYVIDTTEKHTFVNADDTKHRYHIGGHPHFMWSWDSILNNDIVMESYS